MNAKTKITKIEKKNIYRNYLLNLDLFILIYLASY